MEKTTREKIDFILDYCCELGDYSCSENKCVLYGECGQGHWYDDNHVDKLYDMLIDKMHKCIDCIYFKPLNLEVTNTGKCDCTDCEKIICDGKKYNSCEYFSCDFLKIKTDNKNQNETETLKSEIKALKSEIETLKNNHISLSSNFYILANNIINYSAKFHDDILNQID